MLMVAMSFGPSRALAQEAEPSPSGEYEIDYEEEPEAPATPEEEAPVEEPVSKKPGKRAAGGAGTGVQGTHSKNRFAPMLKSDTKSIYKKNGKALDVDTD